MTPNRRRFAQTLAGAAASLALPALAQAAFPSRPVRMIINFPPGGSPDIIGRSVAVPLSQYLGQQVVVENRSGASGTIGVDAVAKSAPDGYTLLLSSGSAMSIVPHLQRVPYSPKDVIPVAPGARLEVFLVTRGDLPVNNIQDFLRYLRANPGRLSYASPGNGSSPHIAGEMMKAQADVFAVHIPYRGSAAVVQDMLAGRIDFAFDPGTAFPHVRSGRLKLLAVGAAKRSALFPDVPTLAESGLPGFDAGTTHGFWYPAGTPAPIVERMNREINRTMGEKPVIDAIRNIGAEPTPMSPQQFGQVIESDSRRYAVIIRERKISAE
jgi:tripartite-type tricarboxylate transporter receptor subunit TctC